MRFIRVTLNQRDKKSMQFAYRLVCITCQSVCNYLGSNTIRFLFLLLSSFFSQALCAQQEFTPEEAEELILQYNDIPLRQDTTDEAKIQTALFIQQTLLDILKSPDSWKYPFDGLRLSTIPIASHPKSDVRIFTFNVILNNGVFHQYGVIQRKKRNEILTYPLIDTAQNLPANFMESGIPPEQWIGCIYYQLQPFKHGKTQTYMLFGFDGHNKNSNRSILDVLYFEFDEPLFGYELFRSSDEDPTPEAREVFEYHKSVKLTLRYQEEGKHIVMEDLVPSGPQFKGNPFYYIPSGDYHAYFQQGKTWVKKVLTDDLPFAPKVEIDVDEIKKDLPR